MNGNYVRTLITEGEIKDVYDLKPEHIEYLVQYLDLSDRVFHRGVGDKRFWLVCDIEFLLTEHAKAEYPGIRKMRDEIRERSTSA